MLALLLLFGQLFASFESRKPILSPIAFPAKLTSGQRVIITCSVLEGDPPIRLSWLKDGQSVSQSVEEVSMGELGSSLLFRRVERVNSGLYVCFASNHHGNASSQALLQVREAPTFTVEPGDRAAVVGGTVRFDCQAQGFPLPVIRWKLNSGQPLSSNYRVQSLENGSLALSMVAKDDEGVFTCEASNGVGDDISRSVRLKVNVGAHFKRHFQVVRVLKNEKLSLSCQPMGETPLSVKWQRERSDVTLRYSVAELNKEDQILSTLETPRAQRVDSGLFTCIAWNAFGQSETQSQVIVEEPPDAPKALQLASKGSRSASIVWSEPFDGNRQIQKYVIEWESRVLETKETKATLNDLEPLSQVKVSVRALNSLGASPPSQLLFLTDEEIPTSAPKEVKVVALSSSSLKVTWLAAEGRSRGYYIGYKRVSSRDPTTFNTVEFESEFLIQGLESDAKYHVTVQAFNNKGAGPQSAPVLGHTLAFDAPEAPLLVLWNSTLVTMANLTWSVSLENPVSGFRLFSRALPDTWRESGRSLDSSVRSLTVTSLECGRHLSFYLLAFNQMGQSKASNIVSRDLTKVGVGVPPPARQLILVNGTRALLHLSTWRDTCPVQYFHVQYKPLSTNEWTLVSDHVIRESTLEVEGLEWGAWYSLLLSAHFNKELKTTKEYVFATKTREGATVPPMAAERRLSRYFIVLIPISCAISVLLGFVVVYICLRRSQETTTTLSMSDFKKEERTSNEMEENAYDLPLKTCSHHCY